MSTTGDFDHPATPGSPGAWDTRSAQLLEGNGESAREDARVEVPQGAYEDARVDASRAAEEDARVAAHGGAYEHARVQASQPADEHTRVQASQPADEHARVQASRAEETQESVKAPSAAGPDVRAATERPASTAATPSTPSTPADRKPPAPRRGAVDPVKALMHRHRELCERAVDPLEIAAGLEALGITDRTAARFRHRDVFSLAEEMYARVPRTGDTPTSLPPSTPDPDGRRVAWVVLSLLPGALGAAAVAGLRLTEGRARLFVAVAGVLAVAVALRAVLRSGPLSSPYRLRPGARPAGTRTWTWWLLAYAALGDALLTAALTGGPDSLPDGTAAGAWPLAAAPVLALALACAPAAWCAHLLSAGARRRLAASRGLEEFAAAVRPLLLGVFAVFLAALTALLALCAAALHEPAGYAQALTLGALLLLARLLTTHGATRAPGLVLGVTAGCEAAVLAAVFTARLPGCGFLATPVDVLVDALGPGSVPALLCGAAALTLLVHATRTLTRASAHARADHPR